MSTSPALVAALIDSTVVSAEQRAQLVELQRQDPEGVEAFLEAAELVEPDAAKRQTLLQKISQLRVVERVQLAMKGHTRSAQPAHSRLLQGRATRGAAISLNSPAAKSKVSPP